MTISQTVCIATSMFIAHLVNQSVAHELVALEMLIHLLETPADDGVEIAVGFLREVGQYLDQNAPKSTETIYKRLRAILQEESAVSKRVQYMIEVIFQVRKDKFKDNPSLPEGLDLVQEDDQITHEVALDDELQVQDSLSRPAKILITVNPLTPSLTDIFKFDPNFLENEAKYKDIKNEILGSDDEEDDSDGSEEESAEEGGGTFLPAIFK
jgi:pre-mRNA-splicing factor CWC22